MSGYMPTTDHVREDFAYPWEGYTQDREGRLAAFDRWLTEHTRQAKADGFDEGVRASGLDLDYMLQLLDNNPYAKDTP